MTEEEIRCQLVHYARRAYERGLVGGTGGNFSARLGDERMLIMASGVSLADTTFENLVTVDIQNHDWQAAGGVRPSKEVLFHAEILRRRRVELACMAGFLKLWRIPADFKGRVMNIHPALLPDFGGRGFYGHRVHEAVLSSGAGESGCTVHFADNEYDHGPIILQRRVPVLAEDTPESLADRVFEQELVAYPEAIRLFAAGRLKVEGRRVTIAPAPGARG